jgi:hypothetical protein
MSADYMDSCIKLSMENHALKKQVAALEARLREAGEQKPFGHFITDSQHNAEDFVRGELFEANDTETVVALYTAAPVPAHPDDSKFPTVSSGEPVIPEMRGYLMQCCDCGLVHSIDFDVIKTIASNPNGSFFYETITDDSFRVEMRVRRAGCQPQPAVPEAVAKDALLDIKMGCNNLNDAAWLMVQTLPKLSGDVFNNLKPALRLAIQHYNAAILSATDTEVKNGDHR